MSMRFRQHDLKRALKGARDAGIEPEEARIMPDGEIRLMLRRRAHPSETPSDVADEIAEWAKDAG